MPASSHRLPRALLLSVGLHLGLGLWLWTRRDPEAPPPAPLQVPVTLQFVELEVPLLPPRTDPPQAGAGPVTPARRVLVPRTPRRSSLVVPEAEESSSPLEAPGSAHPHFVTLGRSMLQHWDPEHVLAVGGFEGTFGMDRGFRAEMGRSRPEDAGLAAHERQARRRQTRDQLRTSRRATVRVFQDARGRLLGAVLVFSSLDPNLTVVAHDSVRRAAARLPPLAAGFTLGHDVMSVWQLELTVAEHPPEPSAGLTLDAEQALTEIHLPPGQHLYKRVRLLEVRLLQEPEPSGGGVE